jgi:hypothetical protein
MAIPTAPFKARSCFKAKPCFKAGLARPVLFLPKGHLALSWSGFLAIVSMRAKLRTPRNRQTEKRKETP